MTDQEYVAIWAHYERKNLRSRTAYRLLRLQEDHKTMKPHGNAGRTKTGQPTFTESEWQDLRRYAHGASS